MQPPRIIHRRSVHSAACIVTLHSVSALRCDVYQLGDVHSYITVLLSPIRLFYATEHSTAFSASIWRFFVSSETEFALIFGCEYNVRKQVLPHIDNA